MAACGTLDYGLKDGRILGLRRHMGWTSVIITKRLDEVGVTVWADCGGPQKARNRSL